jgi:hypothetical protein
VDRVAFEMEAVKTLGVALAAPALRLAGMDLDCRVKLAVDEAEKRF